MATNWLEVRQQQRVDVEGQLSPNTEHLWIGLHGYGQLVQFFSRHFRDLANTQRAFVFPQGPHKFYLEGVHGRVGASWMTKEDRLVDIQNQWTFLDEVIAWATSKAPNARIHFVGFSQGVATGMRYLGNGKFAPMSFLAWAGSWPPDLEPQGVEALKSTRFKGWFGSEDAYIDLDKQAQITTHYREEFGLEMDWDRYEGGHSFDKAILAEAITQLEQ
jgi:predicted esterase